MIGSGLGLTGQKENSLNQHVNKDQNITSGMTVAS